MPIMNKRAVHQITEELGTEKICSRLNVTSHSVRSARTNGVFPGNWYGVLKPWCDEVGIPCPLDAFKWKSSAKKTGDGDNVFQGKARKEAKETGAAE
ncbi:MAG: hypothetical protein EpisKO_41350 [Epibacterium sp.]